MIHNFCEEDHTWDICVVGTGPVGMGLALEFERLGREVLVLESGGLEVNPELAEASRAEIVDPERHVPMEIAVCRALGGTSWDWAGRCVTYDDVDWVTRDFVADAHWPFGHDEIRPWYQSAAQYLGCGSGTFSAPYKIPLYDGLQFDAVERWAHPQKTILRYRDHLLGSERIKLSLQSTVTNLNLSADGQRVESLIVHTPKGVRKVRARRFVLAMGGVETTRLLLVAQQRYPRSFGGADGPLGRYYMGHLQGQIANVSFSKTVEFEDLDFRLDESGAYRRRRFTISAEKQLEHKLLNTVFWADNPFFYDPSHRSFALSAIYLALRFKPTGTRLVSEGIRRANTGPGTYPLSAHLRNLILGAPRGVLDLYPILRDRYITKPRKILFMIPNPQRRYRLTFNSEQVPMPESRIKISNQADCFGMPRAFIDLRLTKQDVQSVLDSHAVLNEALQSNGLGSIQYLFSQDELYDQVLSQAHDGYHQVGTTRMGTDPTRSVVDPNLKVHDLENLYLAASSVFPTASYANSTFLAVAFGLRLANHLNGRSDCSEIGEMVAHSSATK